MNFDLDLERALRDSIAKIGGWIEGFIEAVPNLLAAVLILLLFWALSRLVRRVVAGVLGRVSDYGAVNRLLTAIASILVLSLGIFIALGVLNLDKTVTTLLAGAGVIGLALGFAAQGTVENFIAGILISIRRPLREGDLIETNDYFGTVREVNLRATVVGTLDGQMVYVPNSEVIQNPLINYSELGQRRVDLRLGVSYADDLEKAKRVAIEAVEGIAGRVAGREAELFYEEFGGSSINFQLRFWIEFEKDPDFLGARSDAIVRIKRAFDENGISIPFPIRTLDFGIAGGRSLAEELAAAGGTGAK